MKKITILSLEPTPYNIDLFNCFVEKGWDTHVHYTQAKDYSLDAGHDYKLFPETKFTSSIILKKTFLASLLGAIKLHAQLRKNRPIACLIAGYSSLGQASAVGSCLLLRIPYAMWADSFNIGVPSKGGLPALILRNLLRRIVFSTARVICVCGVAGKLSAIAAGCSPTKLEDFPYVIDRHRIISLQSIAKPSRNILDLSESKLKLLYSGRLIERKGLHYLLAALAKIVKANDNNNWVLWVEGDGPLRGKYVSLAKEYGILDRCQFLGFCQMDLHAWLLGNCDIVVLPSAQDPWGIVVDEAMQLGKPVLASSMMGSAQDRIVNGVNGMMCDIHDEENLMHILATLMGDMKHRSSIGINAASSSQKFNADRNVRKFEKWFI